MTMSTWLITGGAGFIGSNFATRLAETRPERLLILDALTYAGNLANIDEVLESAGAEFIRGDICDLPFVRAVFAHHDIERVVHFAAESHVDRSILGPRAFVETNVNGTLNLLLAAQDQWQGRHAHRRFLHVSTDEVYGALSPTDSPFNEETPYAPNSPYAASKAASDHLVRAWHRTYGLPTIITNCSNNYGPFQFPEKLIPLIILNAVDGRELPVYGDGLQVRDWLHVRDHCDALLAILERGRVGETYCVGGDNQQTNLQIVETICALVDARLGRTAGTASGRIRHVDDRPGHDRRYAIDAGKLRRELGWSPKEPFAAGLANVVDWYLNHQDWVDTIRSGEYRQYYEQQYEQRLRARQ
jgi:dTDP-glucose 4,6-dehydratase